MNHKQILLAQEYDEQGYPVCASCGCAYRNFGQGSACDECRYELLVECEADYAEEVRSFQ